MIDYILLLISKEQNCCLFTDMIHSFENTQVLILCTSLLTAPTLWSLSVLAFQ